MRLMAECGTAWWNPLPDLRTVIPAEAGIFRPAPWDQRRIVEALQAELGPKDSVAAVYSGLSLTHYPINI